jgi:hypothetical protein
MKCLYSVEEKRKGRRMVIERTQCPSLSAAIFMLGRVAEEKCKYRIRKRVLNSEKLFFHAPTEGIEFYDSEGSANYTGVFK